MPRMIELIRQSGVPSHVMRSAAHGALSLPAGEMLEILVLLTKNPIFADQARMTLAQWDENSAREVLSDHSTPWEILEYYFSAQICVRERLRLLPGQAGESVAAGSGEFRARHGAETELQGRTLSTQCPGIA